MQIKKIFKEEKTILIAILIITVFGMGIYIYRSNKNHNNFKENEYTAAFCELINYTENVENYLAKSLISKSNENGAATLTEIWKDANLALVYLSKLPISSEKLENASKFLNQVSDYSYSLSRKNIKDENLTEEDLKNLETFYKYSMEISNVLNALDEDFSVGNISWNELNQNKIPESAWQVDNISKTSFGNIDENLNEYAGLIYDGAYSDHVNKADKKGLIGEEIDVEKAKELAKKVLENYGIKEIYSNGELTNADIDVFDFYFKTNEDIEGSIGITKKGGWLLYFNSDRDVAERRVSNEEAERIGKEFLSKQNFKNMEATYFLENGNILTINYAYNQNGIIVYPDLIKVKIALDNGNVLGIESTGYLNSHEERKIPDNKITSEQAKKDVNKNLEILSEKIAIIPTKWKTEKVCYEIKGKVYEREFLVYINIETGEEEDILVILETEGGTLTM